MVAVLVDTSWCCHRFHHSYRQVGNARREPVGVLYGFARAVDGIRANWPDAQLWFCDDRHSITRRQIFEGYKAKREPPPPSVYALKDQALAMVSQLPRTFVAARENYEADDVMAALFYGLKVRGYKVIIHTSDNDLVQLAPEGAFVYHRISRSHSEYYDEAYVKKKYGVSLPALVYFRVLRGDSSDDIPSVYTRIPVAFCQFFAEMWALKGTFREAFLGASPRYPMECKRLLENVEALKRNAALISLRVHKVDTPPPESFIQVCPQREWMNMGFFIKGDRIRAHVRWDL